MMLLTLLLCYLSALLSSYLEFVDPAYVSVDINEIDLALACLGCGTALHS